MGIKTHFLSLRDMPIRHPTLFLPLNLPFAWAKIRHFDFIHAVGDAAFTAVLWKTFLGAPIVYDVDADTLAEAYMHWEARRDLQRAFWVRQTRIMNRVAYRSGDYFIVVSRPLLERLVNQKGVPRERLYIVRNGVDIGLFRPALGGANGPFTVCYAGSFHTWQGVQNLVTAGRLLKGQSIHLKIIGFRPEDYSLKASIADALGDMVELVDRLPQSELVNHLSAAHFLVIPRQSHPAVDIAFPTKFAEYLAMGKPVIVSDVDETSSFVREHQCGLVSAPNPQALAETICQGAALSQAELVRMGQNGRRLAEMVFDWSAVCGYYAGLLRQWKREIHECL